MSVSDTLIVIAMLLVSTMCMLIVFILTIKNRKDNDEISGTLMVSTDDPDGPYIFLELDISPSVLTKKHRVTFTVKHLKTNSRK